MLKVLQEIHAFSSPFRSYHFQLLSYIDFKYHTVSFYIHHWFDTYAMSISHFLQEIRWGYACCQVTIRYLMEHVNLLCKTLKCSCKLYGHKNSRTAKITEKNHLCLNENLNTTTSAQHFGICFKYMLYIPLYWLWQESRDWTWLTLEFY